MDADGNRKPRAGSVQALAALLAQALLQFAQARIDRRLRIKIAVTGAAGDFELLDRRRQAALQQIELGLRPMLRGALTQRRVGTRQQAPQPRIVAAAGTV